MPQSLAQVYVHIVFSTKLRRPFLRNERTREEMHGYLAGICRNLDSSSLIVGGVEDHIHILCTLSRKWATSDFLRELKRDSSKWIKSEHPDLAQFEWQAKYGIFSVSPSHVESLKRYIAHQKEHHRKETFQDEFRRLLKKYGISYDERYVWD